MENNEQLYFGGTIITVDEARPKVEAIAIRNGIIVSTGSYADCRAALGSSPQLIDLKGSVMLPGFIDTHLHPPVMIFFQMNLDLGGVASLSELQDTMSKHAGGDDTGEWLLGLQFDEMVLHGAKRSIREILDGVCLHRPVAIITRDGHSVLANSKAISTAGVSGSTPDPEGGKIEHLPSGELSGVFRETAMSILTQAIPLPPLESIISAGIRVFERIASYGITSVGMMLQTGSEGIAGDQGVFDLPLMEMLLEHIPINLYSLLVVDDITKMATWKQSALNQPAGNRDRTIGGIKFWADGAFGSCTAFMDQPFSDFPQRNGFLIHPPEKMYERMAAAHKAGEQIAIHTIGDASTRVCLDLFERLFREFPDINSCHRLEHASQLNEELIADIARLNLVVSTQPLFINSEKEWLPKRLGPERIQWTYPHRALLDAGVVVAGASDAPIEETNVLQAISCCITREGFEPQQAITPEEAIRMFTQDAAFAQNEEAIKGSLCDGKRADLVILDKNPLSVPADQIPYIQVEKTVCGGKIIYCAEGKTEIK
jgi:predicted amidohydrolase YtcJ